jgi:sporulation protein YlmC with PRC-barrel domain
MHVGESHREKGNSSESALCGGLEKEKAVYESKATHGRKLKNGTNGNMQRKLQIIIGASAASVLALSALAQDTPNPTKDRPNYTRDRMPQAQRPNTNRLNDAAKASDLIGMTVKNNQNEKLGKVEDLAVDVESGRVVQVILSTGGVLGIGDTLTAVPPGALKHDIANKVLLLDADKEKLKGAPKFEMSNWAEYSDSNHLSEVYGLYGEEQALRFIQTRAAVSDGQRNTDGSLNKGSIRTADATGDQARVSKKGQCLIPVSRLSQVQRASKLMGTPVTNLQDEKLGKVENLLVDLLSGRVVEVIVSSGGFLGMGDELSAIPPTALRFTSDRNTLQLDASKELLSRAPHFKANRWPDLGQPSYADSVYRAYKVEPYFASSATTDPDNTARNVRDRNDSTITPLDQGNSKADVDTTAQIRKEIVAGKNMSVNAKNVKIITKDGQVTLRGPVNTAEEKRLIGEIADRIARSGNVDNQLEVKLTTSSNN